VFSSRLRILEGGCLDEDEERESWGLRGMGGVLGLDVVEGVGLGNVLLIVLSVVSGNERGIVTLSAIECPDKPF